jgi:hypothetical protein
MAKTTILEDEALTPTNVAEKPQDIRQRTKAALEAQPKRSIMIPKEKNDQDGAFETVQINGYTYQIKKGVYVEVPELVAQIIMDAKKQTDEAYAKARQSLSPSERPEFDNSK